METMHLMGSEEVARAASTIRNAADEMNRAAGNFECTLHQFVIQLDSLVTRLEHLQESK